MRDLFDVLVRDHRDLQALCWDLDWVSELGDRATASRLLGELASSLVDHVRAEEQLLCRHLEDELAEPVRVTRVGHRTIERALLDLAGTDLRDPRWRTELTALRDLLSSRFAFEERQLFALASTMLDAGEALELGAAAEQLIGAREDDVIELDDDDLAAMTVEQAVA